jgi:hypothetical protein
VRPGEVSLGGGVAMVCWGLLCFRPVGLDGAADYEQCDSASESYGTFQGAPAPHTRACDTRAATKVLCDSGLGPMGNFGTLGCMLWYAISMHACAEYSVPVAVRTLPG